MSPLETDRLRGPRKERHGRTAAAASKGRHALLAGMAKTGLEPDLITRNAQINGYAQKTDKYGAMHCFGPSFDTPP